LGELKAGIAVSETLLNHHLFRVVCPSLGIGSTGDDLSRFGRELFSVKELNVVPRVRLMNGDDVHGWGIEQPQMLFLVPGVPLFFGRSDVIEGLRRYRFVWPGRVHHCKCAGTRIRWRLSYRRPHLRWNAYDLL